MGGGRAMRLLKMLLVLFVCAATPVSAGPLDDASAAYRKGDYATAVRLWRPLAEQGNAHAQYNLGAMYASARGVPLDLVQAHKWISLAASRLSASENDKRGEAIKNRDAIAAKMTPAQIAEAQKLARECVARKYKDCD